MVEPAGRRRRHRVSQALMAIGVADCAGALTAAAGGDLGWVDAVLLGTLYTAPAFTVAALLESDNHELTTVARVAALVLSVLYVAVVAGNWSGYDGRQAILVALLTAPLLVAYTATVWVTHSGPIRHKPGHGPHPVG